MGRNEQKTPLKGIDILGKKVLILGEAGSGKTRLAAKLFQELAMLISPEEITVVDLAPRKVGGIGGKLTDYVEISSGVRYLSPKNVYTPRFAGQSFEQVLHYAQLNRENMEPLLNTFIQNPTKVLIINDVTLYLHLGKLETVLSCVSLAKTFLATAYYGSKLANDLGTGISAKERQLINRLARLLDLTVKINRLETNNGKRQP